MKDTDNSAYSDGKKQKRRQGGSSDAVYGMAFIGSAVYFLVHAATFWEGVLGILKAIVWPAVLIYNLLGFLKM